MISTALKNRPPRKAGRPCKLNEGKPMRVYLDAETVSKAVRLGDGNLSAGIRRAVNEANKALKQG